MPEALPEALPEAVLIRGMTSLRRALGRCARAARAVAMVAALAVVLGQTSTALAVSDPSLRWYTIETPHFRITYHSGIEQVAQHVANVCEGIYDGMRSAVGWTPSEPTEIILTDVSESANGSAGASEWSAPTTADRARLPPRPARRAPTASSPQDRS